jgi:hypothetical protein
MPALAPSAALPLPVVLLESAANPQAALAEPVVLCVRA